MLSAKIRIVRPARAIIGLEAEMDKQSKAGNSTLLVLAGLILLSPFELAAQVPVDESGQPLPALEDDTYLEPGSINGEALSDLELEELIGPIALYPDDLLAIVLPASTYPLEIVQAARFLDALAKDSSLEPDESWDESVVALLNYPEVVYMMDKEIDWTWRLGEAVINQQPGVLAAVESFRERAYAAGNLKSDERQTVRRDEGAIEIEPVEEDIIYVPYYEPEEVVVYQPRRVYHYYPYAYPVYYYPYPVGYRFATGYFWGVTTAFTIGWHSHYLHVHHPSYWGHPYYGRHYYGHYYRRPSITVFNYWYGHRGYSGSHLRYRDGDHWRPRHHRSGARPATQHVRNYHYSGGDVDTGRSNRREQNRNHLRRDSRHDVAANNHTRTRSNRNADRTRDNVSSNRLRSAVVDNDGNRRGSAADRQRNRVDTDRVRADRGTSGNADRQRLTARNAQQAIANAESRRGRQAAQHDAPPRATRFTGNSNRQAVQRQAPPPRQATRPVAQRQAPARQATRQRVERQAAPQRQATRPAVQRQSNVQEAAPANRGQGRANRTRRRN